MKLAVVTPIPTPYRDSFWSAVNRHPGLDLHVMYCAAGKADRPWNRAWSGKFHAEVLEGRNLASWRGPSDSLYWNPEITKRLRAGRFDAIVIGGYNHPTLWAAARHAQKQKIPLYLMCESHLHGRRSAWRRQLKQYPLRWLASRCNGGFPTGQFAEEYLAHYGMPADRLTRIPNVPDVDQLTASVRNLRQQRSKLRKDHCLADNPTVLFVGRLIPKKRAGLLISAFYNACRNQDVQLVIVGDGVEREPLRQQVARLKLERQVHFAEFVQPNEMPAWYAMADLFVLPSSETWGVAVVEALASGLPAIVTDEVGCHPDVVVNSTVGTVVAARDQQALSAAIQVRLSSLIDPQAVFLAWNGVHESLRYEVLAGTFVSRITQRTALQSSQAA